jgi:glycosyltransferase involved in cell wall biosynthesis
LRKKKWQSDEEVSDLHSFDIGLMPLSDDLWSRGKCGFKILQYMAAGLPVVCSPVGVNREIIENGVQGFWAETQEQWVEKISALIMQPELRKQMGLEGRKRATDHYSLTANQPHFLKVLHSL